MRVLVNIDKSTYYIPVTRYKTRSGGMKHPDAPVSPGLPGHLIRRLHQQSTQLFTKRVQEAGSDLTPVQFAALDALRDLGGIDQAGLAEMIAKDRATTGAVIARLRQKGLIARVVNSRDRRAHVLTLTEAGADLVSRLIPVVVGLQREILSGLDENDYNRFIELATKAVRAGGNESTG